VKWKSWIKVLLVFFLTADLFGNMGFYGKERTSEYFRKTRILERISSDQGHFRIFATSKTISMDIPILIASTSPFDFLKEKHLPPMNLLYHLYNIWGIDVIHLKRVDDLYIALISASSISDTPLIDLYGVKYVISVTLIEKDPRFELIYSRLEGLQGKKEDLLKENTIKLYRNKNPILRGWLVKDFKVLDQKSILTTLTSKEFDPRKEVFFEEEPKWAREEIGNHKRSSISSSNPPNPSLVKGEKGGVDWISESNNRLRLLVMAKENAFLVLNDTYFPGWKAFVDGKEEKVLRANYNFRAVLVRAGTHRVEFVYDPLSFKLGTIVTLIGIIGCFAIGLATRHREPHPWVPKES
jgi:hypothetical protein